MNPISAWAKIKCQSHSFSEVEYSNMAQYVSCSDTTRSPGVKCNKIQAEESLYGASFTCGICT